MRERESDFEYIGCYDRVLPKSMINTVTCSVVGLVVLLVLEKEEKFLKGKSLTYSQIVFDPQTPLTWNKKILLYFL